MAARVVSGVGALLFLYAVVVQLNDPDPVPWVLWYGTASAFCFAAAIDRFPVRPALAYTVLALLNAGLTFTLGQGSTDPMGGFPAWGPLRDEVVREALGLTLAALWVGGTAGWFLRKRAEPTPPA